MKAILNVPIYEDEPILADVITIELGEDDLLELFAQLDEAEIQKLLERRRKNGNTTTDIRKNS